MQMHVNISKEIDLFIKEQVKTGFYSNGSEVVQDAIRKMEANQKIDRSRTMVALGDAQIERGQVTLYTSSLMDELEQEALENSKIGKK